MDEDELYLPSAPTVTRSLPGFAELEAALAAKDAEIERLTALVKRAGEQLQASTRTMNAAKAEIERLKAALDIAPKEKP